MQKTEGLLGTVPLITSSLSTSSPLCQEIETGAKDLRRQSQKDRKSPLLSGLLSVPFL